MDDNNTVKKILFETEQINCLFELYAEVLDKVKQHDPDLIQVTAPASVLHSFYNGLENIFLHIAKGIDKEVPADSAWHRKLLMRMSEETPNRKAVLSAGLSETLTEYMGFRHFHRHSYSFFLDWQKLEKLVIPVSEIWKQVREELQMFLKQQSNHNV